MKILVITLFYFPLIYGLGEQFRSHGKHEYVQPLYKRGPMSYVVEQGCPYLTHYVRDNYFSTVNQKVTTSATVSSVLRPNINWVGLVYQEFAGNYVPLELFHGLVKCGKTYALYAVNPSGDIINRLNANFTIIPGVGK